MGGKGVSGGNFSACKIFLIFMSTFPAGFFFSGSSPLQEFSFLFFLFLGGGGREGGGEGIYHCCNFNRSTSHYIQTNIFYLSHSRFALLSKLYTGGNTYRGYYTVARRYEFYVLVARTISHSFASLTREILFLPPEHKIHIFSPPCNVLFIIWRNQFNKSQRRESWLHWTIRHSQRWHTENTPLGSRMKWRAESTSGLVPSKTLFSI